VTESGTDTIIPHLSYGGLNKTAALVVALAVMAAPAAKVWGRISSRSNIECRAKTIIAVLHQFVHQI